MCGAASQTQVGPHALLLQGTMMLLWWLAHLDLHWWAVRCWLACAYRGRVVLHAVSTRAARHMTSTAHMHSQYITNLPPSRLLLLLPCPAGDVVTVADDRGEPIAWGVYNPHSMFRVRILQTEAEVAREPGCLLDVPAVLKRKVAQAAQLRAALGLPNEHTDVYR